MTTVLECVVSCPMAEHRAVTSVAYQHCGAQVKLAEKLGDEDVSLDNLLLVNLFEIVQDVDQPFVVFLTCRHPDEVHLKKKHGKPNGKNWKKYGNTVNSLVGYPL